MAAQHLTGKNGSVVIGTGTPVTYVVTGWSFDPAVDLQETTNSGTSGFKTYECGLAGGTGSFTVLCPVDDAPTELAPGTVFSDLSLMLDGETALLTIGEAICSQLPVASEVAGTVKFTCNFTVNGSFNL